MVVSSAALGPSQRPQPALPDALCASSYTAVKCAWGSARFEAQSDLAGGRSRTRWPMGDAPLL